MSYDIILGALGGLAVVGLILSLRPKLGLPSYHDNHTIPAKKALEIATATFEGRPAIFHGGCCDCIWRHQNTTHVGIDFCRGCSYFCFNQSLPDKSISEYDLEKL